MESVARPLVTEAEFLAMPESTERIELIDGEVTVAPSPSFWHQEVLRRLVQALSQWADHSTRPVTVTQAPLDVKFGAARILQPDACVFLDAIAPDHEGPIERIPDLCVEVLSQNRTYDRITKRYVYAEAGVQEYWVVEQAGLIEVWYGDHLSRSRTADARLETDLLPGLSLDLTALFSR